jgi:NADPH:quinone reductase-like Zn-dependent oxidoreductase
VQLAKYFGAVVTAVVSTQNIDQARELGADASIDYTRVDFTKARQQYDLILAVSGYHPLLAYRRALKPSGRYVLVGASSHLNRALLQTLVLGPVISRMGRRKMGHVLMASSQEDLIFLKDLLIAGNIKPMVEKTFPFPELPAALRYLEGGHVRGKIALTM